MGKDFIGKRVRLTIGKNPPPKDDGVVIGDDTDVHITPEEASKYQNIYGEKVELRIGDQTNSIVENIISIIKGTNEEEKGKIVSICKDILKEKDKQTKRHKIKNLIAMGSGIASIAQFCIQLKTMLGV